MEIRKVQITGGSSYVITLPKEWAKSLNIKKNDPLGLIVQSDGTLLITPETKKEQIQRTKEFDITNIDDPKYFFRLLIGAYISGFSNVLITSRKRIEPYMRDVIRKFTQMTIGQEVAEETETSVHLKDLLNPGEMPFDKTVKRMYIITRGMHEESINALKEGDRTITEHILARDNEVDKLNWLIARQYNLIFRDVNLLEKMGITRERATNYYMISRILERIGDHGVIIGTYVPTLIEKRVNKKIVNKIIAASDLALAIMDKSIESLYKRNLKELNKNIESVKKLQSLCEETNTMALPQKGLVAIAVGYIVESIRRIGEYAVNISETVINYQVGEDS